MTREVLTRILDLARWAPSGDNTQPWRFEIVADDHVVVHGHDTRDWCLYDYRGHASHMAHGALLETMRVAATAGGLRCTWALRPDSSELAPIYDVRFMSDVSVVPDALLPAITTRAVQRRPMKTTPLTEQQKQALAAAVGAGYELSCFESWAQRRKLAWLLWRSAYVRLVCPEAFEVHRQIIEWRAQFSDDKIPEQAVGVDPATARLMQWAMGSWARVNFMNRFLLGTVPPRLQLDVLPALACAAHLMLKPVKTPEGVVDHVEAGAAMQRLWLTATHLGLHLQPEMTPVIFRWYARAGEVFSADARINDYNQRLALDFESVLLAKDPSASVVFLCRVGRSTVPESRSLRLPLERLWA